MLIVKIGLIHSLDTKLRNLQKHKHHQSGVQLEKSKATKFLMSAPYEFKYIDI